MAGNVLRVVVGVGIVLMSGKITKSFQAFCFTLET